MNEAAQRCIACGQVLPLKGRHCSKCGGPILKGHKYLFSGGAVEHRNCEEPMKREAKSNG